jgi:acylpyruvate hydrolase
MKLATIRTGVDGETVAVRIEGDSAVELDARDVGEVLARPGWTTVDGRRRPVAGLDYAPLIPRPDKIICVGLNYRDHVAETGRELPEHPTLFAKYRASLIGANDEIVLPAVSDAVDYEAELAVIIGARARHVSVADAPSCIAGYAVLNDVSVRDYQNRTLQFLQGKTFESSTPLGPWLVTADESPGVPLAISCAVDGEVLQHGSTGDLVFGPAELVSYISAIITLEPGDVIATGTPSGVGAARTPPRWLRDGETVVTTIEGLGSCVNVCRKERLEAG